MIIYTLPGNLELEPVVRDGRGTFVAVFLSSIVTDQLQNFRCVGCGWVVAQFSNKQVDALVYGQAIPENKNAVDIRCSRCRVTYRIV
jgi:hypothetical protein